MCSSSSSPFCGRAATGSGAGAGADSAADWLLIDASLWIRWRTVRASRQSSPALSHRVVRRDEHFQQRLLRVPAVLGLVPDALARAVEDLGGDLVAGMGGQVVHGERAGGGGVEQRVVDAVGAQRAPALGGG